METCIKCGQDHLQNAVQVNWVFFGVKKPSPSFVNYSIHLGQIPFITSCLALVKIAIAV